MTVILEELDFKGDKHYMWTALVDHAIQKKILPETTNPEDVLEIEVQVTGAYTI